MKRSFILAILVVLAWPVGAFGQTWYADTVTTVPGLNYSAVAWGDYDNDGDQDLLICGYKFIAPAGGVTKLFRNDGNSSFNEVAAGFTGVSRGTVAWGDYDNDNDLDALIVGTTGTLYSNSVAEIWENNGGIFTNINAGLTGVISGATFTAGRNAAWGDYNNDGYQDIVLTGKDISGYLRTMLYANNGDGTFTLDIELTGLNESSADWGDYDNDGDLDLLHTGQDEYFAAITIIERNNGDGSFTTLSNTGIDSVHSGDAQWGDFDADGDLDVVITGYDTNVGSRITKAYRNSYGSFSDLFTGTIAMNQSSLALGDYNNDGYLDFVINGYDGSSKHTMIYYYNTAIYNFQELAATSFTSTASGAVAWADYKNNGLLGFVAAGSGYTKLYYFSGAPPNGRPIAPAWLSGYANKDTIFVSWPQGSDTKTPSAGLSYSLFIAPTTAGELYLVSPMADTGSALPYGGIHYVPAMGNMGPNTSYVIAGVPEGQYSWGVQSVDGNFTGSYFKRGWNINVADPPDTVDVTVSVDTTIGQVTLNWAQSTAADFSHYNIYWNNFSWPGTKRDSIFSVTQTTYTVDTLANYQGYYFDVRPVDTNGNIAGSRQGVYAYVYNAPPAEPLNLVASDAMNGSVTLNWDPVDVADFQRYRVYFRKASEGNYSYTITTDFDPYATQYTLTWLYNDTTYYFHVKAEDQGGNLSPQSNTVSATPIVLLAGEYAVDGNTRLLLHMNETGSSLADVANAGRYATAYGGTWATTGRTGNARYYNGTDTAKVYYGYNDKLTFGKDDFTAELWVQTWSTAQQRLLFRYTYYTQLWNLDLINGIPSFGLQGKAGYGEASVSATTNIATGQWHHVAAVREAGIAKIYVDGVLENSVDVTALDSTDTQSGVFYVGGYNYSPTASLDEVRVSNIARQPGEFNLQLPPTDLTATSEVGGATLSWANGGGVAPLMKYRIYQRLLGDTNWTLADSIAVTSHALSGLTTGQTYDFAVTAVDSTWFESGYSNVASVTAGGAFLEVSATGLPQLNDGTIDWGDYDNDGDLDVLLTGYDDGAVNYYANIYRNDGGGVFTDIGAGLPGVSASAAAWGDYDNDGDLDIVLSGSGNAKVYHNDGGGTFTDIGAGLADAFDGSLAWGDYDNDGDLDILLTGSGNGIVYRNDSGSFTDVGAGLPGVSNSVAAWGDYDNDGDLDIVLTGYDGSDYRFGLYRNDGGVFTWVTTGIPGVTNGSVEWGDYDADGDLDLLFTGFDGGTNYYARIYRNDGGVIDGGVVGSWVAGIEKGTATFGDYDNDGDLDILLTGSNSTVVYRNDGGGAFTDIGAGLVGVSESAAAWGDYDNDGKLDILVSGASYTKLYRNNGSLANYPPTFPDGLTSTEMGPGKVSLDWLSPAAADDHTPLAGLSYSLRVGTTSGGSEIVAPHSTADGYRKVAELGNVQANTSWTLENLPAGTYYWSVQAVDGAFAGSPFAAEQSFVQTQVAVTFQVDMRVYAIQGKFDPAADSVFVRGIFNSWDLSNQMFDTDGDTIYQDILSLTAETTVEYKFYITSGPDDVYNYEDVVGPGGSGNRVLNVGTADQVLSVVMFNEPLETPPNPASAYFNPYSGSTRLIRVRTAVPLDGNNSNPAGYNLSAGQFTIEAHVKPMEEVAEGDTVIIAGHLYDGFSTALAYGLILYRPVGGATQVAAVVSDGSTVGAVNNPITLHKWSHVAGVYNGANLTLYVDGAGKGAVSYTTGGADPGSYAFYLGLGTGQRLVGFVDELRIWDVARTSTEITDNMMTTLTGSEPNLRGYWPLNNRESFTDPITPYKTYEIARDYSPNQNHLVVFNDITFMAAVPFGGPLAPELVATGEHYAVADQGFAFYPAYGGGPTTTVSLVSGSAGMSYNSAASAAVWTPNTDQAGRHTFTLEAKNTAGSVQQDYSVWVDAVVAEAREHNTNTIAMSVYNNGAIGGDAFSSDPGSGFVYNGLNGLWAGELLIGQINATDTVISGGMRANDFATRTGIEDVSSTKVYGSTGYNTVFDDQRSLNPLGVTVSQWTHDADNNDYVTVIYSVVNNSASTLAGLHIGLALDWDVGDPYLNQGSYDENATLAYVFESAEKTTNTNYYGVTAIQGGVSGVYVGSDDNYYDEALSTTFYGRAMTTLDYTPAAAGDMRSVLALGPFELAPGGRQNVAFALVAGNDLADLRGNAAAAHSNFVSYPVAQTNPPKTVGGDFAQLQGGALTRSEANVYFEYGETEAYGSTVNADQSPLTSSVFDPVSAFIDGLVTNTEYHYQLVVDNGAFVYYGRDMTFTTTGSNDIVTETQVVTEDGEVIYPNASVTLDFTFSGTLVPETVAVTRFNNPPSGGALPGDVGLVTPDEYWIIEHQGGSTFGVAMTFVLWSGAILADDQTAPGNLRLLRRDTGSSADWTVAAGGTSANDSSVTFASISGFSEFTIGSTSLAVDTEAPDIADISVNPAVPVDVGTEVVVTASITDIRGLDQVNLHYSSGGGTSYTETAMSPTVQADEYSATIPASAVTITGVVFFVRAADAAANADTSDLQFVPVKFPSGVLTTNIAGSEFSGGFPKDRWRLISVPAALENPSVGRIIGDVLGAATDTSWQLFEYTHNTDQQWRNANTFSAATGYWLHQRVESGVHFDAGAGTTDNLAGFDIIVKPGWNLIGAPYTFSSPVQLDPQTYYGPITFTGSDTALIGWTGIKSELAPWGGHAVYNRTSSNQTITLSAEPGGGLGKDLLAKGIEEQPEGWLLQLQAEGKTYADVANAVGRLAGADEQLDYFDNPEPPYVDGFVSLAMERPDWGANLPRFTSDIRAIEENDGVWDLELFVKGEKGPITLSHALQGDLPPGNRIILLDVMTREVHDLLADDGPLTFTRYREEFPYHLKVVAGSASYVEFTTKEILASLPSDFSLAQNYPNPFNPATHLRYSVFQPARVTLKIYNLLGQEVVTLVDGWQDLGHYEVVWEGRDRFGVQAASGIYFAAYRAEGRMFTRKMVLMK